MDNNDADAPGAVLQDPSAPKVFISYAHESRDHAENVRKLWLLLRENGMDAKIDAVADAGGRVDWPLWMGNMVRWADHVLVIGSTAYRERAEGRATPGEGRGVGWEARLIREEFYKDQSQLDRFVPVLLPGHTMDQLPDFLAPYSSSVYRVREFTVAGAEPLLRLLTRQPLEIEPKRGPIPPLPPRGPGGPAAVPGSTVPRRPRNSDLLDTDVVRAVRAAEELAGSHALDVSAMLDAGRGPEVTRRVARASLATVPDRSGPALLERIEKCGVDGSSWGLASNAADLLSPAHRALVEGQLVAMLPGFHVERARHAITALGRIGATSQADAVAEAADREIGKLGSYAAEALARMFQASAESSDIAARDAVATTLAGFLSRHPPTALYVQNVFHTLTPRHADPLLAHWLPSADRNLIRLAAVALGEMHLRRACRPLADRAAGMADDDAAPLFKAVGRIGGPEAVELLRTRSRFPGMARAVGQGLALCVEHLDEDFDRTARDLLNTTRTYTWAVYRAIGLRSDPRADELLQRGLDAAEGADRGVAALALARRKGTAAAEAVTTAFDQATETVESLMAGLAMLRLDDTDATRSTIVDLIIRNSDTVLRLDGLLFNDVLTELERPGDERLIDLGYALRWLQLRP